MSGCDKIKLGGMIVSSIISANAMAGLGDINVKSHQGEPFQADINLVGFSAEELDNARIALASDTEVRDPDVYSARYLSSLRFTLLSSDHGGMIHISSSLPIDEPSLRFAIKIEALSKWQVREYNAVLDPAMNQPVNKVAAEAQPALTKVALTQAPVPAMSAVPVPVPQAPAPVQTPVVAAAPALIASPQTAPAPQATSLAIAGPAPAVELAPASKVPQAEAGNMAPAQNKPTQKAATAPQQLRATRGTSLWKLARKIKPAQGSLNQTMTALFLANKHAFVGGDPGKLKLGAILQLPASTRIKAVSKGQIDKILHTERLAASTKKPAPSSSTPADNSKPAQAHKAAPDHKPVVPKNSAVHDLRIQELEKKLHSIDHALTKMDGLNKRIERLQEQIKNN